ncbi:MAG TPA: hypothetical protein VK915_04480 [Gaiellaceae bacterium]|nr:hypothetical protein [Gaiellaceae bacterium]
MPGADDGRLHLARETQEQADDLERVRAVEAGCRTRSCGSAVPGPSSM